MRNFSVILLLTGLLFSCSNSDTNKATDDKTTKIQEDTSSVQTERQILIDELRRIQNDIASNDKEIIANLFIFPIPNESFGVYIEDSNFNAQLNENGNYVTRQMFTSYYSLIADNFQVAQINELFRNLNIDQLKETDQIEHEAIIETEPCYSIYRIDLENKTVTLTVGTNSNQNFKSKTVSEDEIPENDSSICEHAIWWTFEFDGKKLIFKGISGAG
jgi:hypothetical protein